MQREFSYDFLMELLNIGDELYQRNKDTMTLFLGADDKNEKELICEISFRQVKKTKNIYTDLTPKEGKNGK